MSSSTDRQVQSLIVQAYACNARIEAMKVANDHAKARGHSEPPFPFGLIQAEAVTLGHIADTLRQMSQS